MQNKKFEELKLKAQSQAVKIGLLNRIYSIIQKENELDSILNLAFCELKNVLGVDKIFFATKDGDTYTITNIYPEKYFYSKNKNFETNFSSNEVYTKTNYIKDLDSITIQDIQEACKKYLDLNSCVLSVLLPQ